MRRPPRRTAPRWFVAALKAIEPRLDVEWVPAKQRWRVTEAVPSAVYRGEWEGGSLLSTMRKKSRVIWTEHLGSKVLEWCRRLKMSRYGSFAGMAEELNVEEDPSLDHRAAALAA